MKKNKLLLVIMVLIIIIFIAVFVYVDNKINDYPMMYLDETSEIAEKHSVPQEIILAVIKVESGFRPAVVSSAGATGLMQIMPATFEEIAFRIGEEPGDITDAETNIRYGTFYLALLYNNFKDWETAYAAYNAGIGRVTGWLSDERYSDDGKTLRLNDIPINETRVYVERVKTAVEKYKKQLNSHYRSKASG